MCGGGDVDLKFTKGDSKAPSGNFFPSCCFEKVPELKKKVSQHFFAVFNFLCYASKGFQLHQLPCGQHHTQISMALATPIYKEDGEMEIAGGTLLLGINWEMSDKVSRSEKF